MSSHAHAEALGYVRLPLRGWILRHLFSKRLPKPFSEMASHQPFQENDLGDDIEKDWVEDLLLLLLLLLLFGVRTESGKHGAGLNDDAGNSGFGRRSIRRTYRHRHA